MHIILMYFTLSWNEYDLMFLFFFFQSNIDCFMETANRGGYRLHVGIQFANTAMILYYSKDAYCFSHSVTPQPRPSA